ncbi:potassium transporter 19-like [Oryza brachyantha]|uniref:Potassium transporter n=1 Tax=Oryza brachyantha TaxID=4533 RepID=J3LXG4_ORYBR|nr:potassium transporter 19-like [Oryza brachyantha]
MDPETDRQEHGHAKRAGAKLQRHDSLYGDAEKVSGAQHHGHEDSWVRTLRLAFQCIGVIYGDIGTSPLYVYAGTFTSGIGNIDDLYGTLSLILYSIILLPMIKYVFIVLYANDNGDGGTFALYSLISRYAKVSLIPNQQAEDAMVSGYGLDTVSAPMKRAQWVKKILESNTMAKVAIFLLTILGTSMVISDGVLTPAISVLSAVSGLQEKAPQLKQGQIVWISVAILVVLFSVQRFGTDKVGYSFAPIILLWFMFIGGIGLYNLIKYDVGVLRAFYPKYIIDYFRRNGKDAWISLGGILLCFTGTEAMFADLGHFNIRSVQLSFSFVLFPAVSLAYIGQTAFLRKHPEHVSDTFYKSIPAPLFWPTLIIAVSAAIIASQAMISGTFAIISQSQTLGCFPRVKVLHTSKIYEGQVYVPEINFALGLLCVIVTLGFQTTTNIGNAYGICVTSVMVITTILLVIVMLLIWRVSVWLIIPFCLVFGSIELVFLSSVLYKFKDGGYLPIVTAAVLVSMMATWHYVHAKKYQYELEHIVTNGDMIELIEKHDVKRTSGVGFLYTELVQGISPIFPHLIEKIPFVHSVLVFVSIKHLPVPHVENSERFLFRKVRSKNSKMFRCVVRYGYSDTLQGSEEFAALLSEHLQLYVEEEQQMITSMMPNQETEVLQTSSMVLENDNARPSHRAAVGSTVYVEETLRPGEPTEFTQPCISNLSGRISEEQYHIIGEEKQFIQREMQKGVVYILGEIEIKARHNSSFIKKIVVNYVYSFLRKNFRQGEKAFAIPRQKVLKVGMAYEI